MDDRDSLLAACRVGHEWLALRTRVLRVPGVQAAVRAGGALLLDAAYGLADLERGVPLTTGHLFRIASHSKMFTATAVLQLVDSGRLRLDDRLGEHLGWVPADVAGVTVRDLLSHGSGVLRDGPDADHWLLAHPFPDADELRLLLGPRVLAPQERFKYSNVGYALLGLVVEAVTGRRYNDHVTTAILEPLGLTDTRPELDLERLADYATGHTGLVTSDTRTALPHADSRALSPATGFSSTARDLSAFAAAHAFGDTRLISDGAKRLAQREEWEVEGADTHYGLGFEVLRVGARRMVAHGGAYPGYITRTLLDPATGLAVSVLTNAIDGPAADLASGLVKLMDRACSATKDGTADGLTRFTGGYANIWGRLDVALFGAELLGLRLDQPDPLKGALELSRVDDATLVVTGGGTGYGAYGETLQYRFGPSGEVLSVRGPGGITSLPVPPLPFASPAP